MDKSILFIDECSSTNTHMMSLIKSGKELPKLFTVATEYQTEGRGQRGNHWFSDRGKNLTISILLQPGTIKVKEQFYISEVAALAVARTIANYLNDEQKRLLKVKWPNDIFYGDKKIAGILIENSLIKDRISYSVIGIGLNINQDIFPEDIPMATSLKNITGKQYDLQEVLKKIHSKFDDMYEDLHNGKFATIHTTYIRRLYRRRGTHSYTDKEGNTFNATIKDVLPTGHLLLMLENGEEKTYNFKEIIFNAE